MSHKTRSSNLPVPVPATKPPHIIDADFSDVTPLIPVPPPDDDVTRFEAFLERLADLAGDGTEISHIDLNTFREGLIND